MQNLDIALKNVAIHPCRPFYQSCTSQWMGDHCYKSHNFFYVLEGGFVLGVDDHSYIVRKHQLALMPAYHPHTYWRLPDTECAILKFSFDAECDGEDLFAYFGCANDHHVVPLPEKEVMEIYRQMHSSPLAPDNVPQRILWCSEIAKLCAMFIQARISMENAKIEFSEVIDFMRSHIAEDVSLETLAASMHFNPTYFSTKFKDQVGIPPMKYFAEMRAKAAAKLLKTTEIPVPAVASAIGFSDIYYFRTFFEKHMGVRPEKYRAVFTRPAELRATEYARHFSSPAHST